MNNQINNHIPLKKFNEEELEKKSKYNKLSYILIALSLGLNSLSDLAVQFYCKDVLLLQPVEVSRYLSLVHFPWTMKPIFGLITDTYPILNKRRKYYIIIAAFTVFFSWFSIAIFPASFFNLILFLTLMYSGMCFASVVGQAIVVELSKLNGEKLKKNLTNENIEKNNSDLRKSLIEDGSKKSQNDAKDFISLFLIFKFTGSLISALFKGYLIKILSYSTIFIITGFLSVFILIGGLILIESDFVQKSEDNSNTNKKSNDYLDFSKKDNKDKIYLNENFDPSFRNKMKNLINFVSQKYIYIPTILLIIFMSTPSYEDPMFFFYTQELKLSSIDLGYVSIFSIVFTLLAIVLYKMKLKEYSFKTLIIGSSVTSFVFSFFTYILTKRYNLIIGIPDMLIILFSSSINSLLGELTLIPMLSLACLLCPKNLEGTAYSLFMSALNFGSILSKVFGSYLMQFMGITSKEYSNLPNLILISKILSLVRIGIFFMFDNKYFSPENNSNPDDFKCQKSSTIKGKNEMELNYLEKTKNKKNDF